MRPAKLKTLSALRQAVELCLVAEFRIAAGRYGVRRREGTARNLPAAGCA